MSVRLEDVLPLAIDVPKHPSDVKLIVRFDWEDGDCCLVLLEDEWGDRYWDLFEYFDWSRTSTENSDLFNVKNESLFEILEKDPQSIARWIPLRFNF
ncbi:hypothetical protein [Turicimonas muris]|uniref:hypothetical protein n=1 Tax=Turicimonas muris TaxID=1796652 RepID=UPI0025737418|nr:hypothetical protein [Turicimonas muris]